MNFFHSPVARRSLRNAVFGAGEGLLVPALWFLTAPVFIAGLGEDNFGIWMMVQGTLGVGSLFGLGFGDATVKRVSEETAAGSPASVVRACQCSVAFFLAMGLVAAVAVFFAAPLLFSFQTSLSEGQRALAVAVTQIGSAALFIRLADAVFIAILQGIQRHDINSVITSAAVGGSIALNVTQVFYGASLPALVACWAACLGVGLLVRTSMVARLVGRSAILPVWRAAEFASMRGYAGLVAVQNITFAALSLDRWLILSLAGPVTVSRYSVCITVTNMLHALLAKGSAFLFPLISTRHAKNDTAGMRRIYCRSNELIVILDLAMVVPLIYLANPLLTLWLGKEFAADATIPLQILLARQAALATTIVNFYFMRGINMIKIQTAMAIAQAVVILTGLSLLVPAYNVVGAAIAWVAPLPLMLSMNYLVECKIFSDAKVAGILRWIAAITAAVTAAVITAKVFPPDPASLVTAIAVALLMSTCVVFLGAVYAFGWSRYFGLATPANTTP